MKTNKKKDALPKTQNKKDKTETNDVLLVGIGASAGGLEALEQFFKKMPEQTGMAFIIIQHLDPTHVGIMPTLLQRITSMKVMQATDQLKIKANTVYVIPPNKSMSVLNGALYLFDPVETRGLRLPIDLFFRSLAEDRLDKSIGIILSGMGSDGSQGIKKIKEKGGIVAVQSPESARFDGMPKSAIDAIIPDIVASADELPDKLIKLLKFTPSLNPAKKTVPLHKSNLDKIIILLREHTGHDFSLYKKTTLSRRIERRKGIHQIDKTEHYVRFLQANPSEIEILFKELLIGVTNFFRDSEVWEKLKESVLPELINKLPRGYGLRAWVTACSTGEEAYTLAIAFKEVLAKLKNNKNITLQIFATDIDKDAIEKARKGIYAPNITNNLTPRQLNRFFTTENEYFKINNSIREMVVFAPQSIVKDPPFTKIDILSCRNLLIYLEQELQKKVISLFNYSLKPEGILILGTAETLGNNIHEFKDVDAKLKIFKHSGNAITPSLIDFPSSFHKNKFMVTEKHIPQKTPENIQSLTDQVLLQRFSPASVLVNNQGDIIYITGKTGKYLEPAAGKANWNIHAMAREGLRHELPGAFRQAIKSTNPVVLKNLKIGINGGTHLVDLTVQQLENPEALKGMLIVVFSDVPTIVTHQLEPAKKGSFGATSQKLKQLEIELQRSYEELQSTREEMQSSQEEQKSTNEELQSTNEELQSTNEELTTSKEEMQSLNEELQTVNIELQSKVNDYVRMNDDMKNLLNSIEIATLFLDKDLNIRRYTEQTTNIFKLRTTDIGRPFTDLVTNLNYPELEAKTRNVLKTLISTEDTVETKDNRWFTIRILPYRTVDDRIDGLVITFTDTTTSKKLEIELKKANDLLVKNEK